MGEPSSLKEIQSCAKDNPFYAVLVTFPQCLPDCLLFRRFSRDGDTSATAIGARRVFLDLAKLDALRGDVVAGIGKVKHAPKGGVWIRLGNLEKWKVWRIGRWKGELVYRRDYAGIGD
jgi:hypothetical protein